MSSIPSEPNRRTIDLKGLVCRHIARTADRAHGPRSKAHGQRVVQLNLGSRRAHGGKDALGAQPGQPEQQPRGVRYLRVGITRLRQWRDRPT